MVWQEHPGRVNLETTRSVVSLRSSRCVKLTRYHDTPLYHFRAATTCSTLHNPSSGVSIFSFSYVACTRTAPMLPLFSNSHYFTQRPTYPTYPATRLFYQSTYLFLLLILAHMNSDSGFLVIYYLFLLSLF